MKVLCRQCRVELTQLNQDLHGFCVECTGNNPATAQMLDEQYRRMAQDMGRRTWELLSDLADDIAAVRAEVRILMETIVGIRKPRKKRKAKKK